MIHFPQFHTTPFDEITRKEVFKLDDGERLRFVRDLLYPYNRFLDVQDAVSEWHKPVGDAGPAEIGDLGLLLGESGNGKSFMLKSFYQKAITPPKGDRMRFPVIYIEVLPGWKAGGFARALLAATGKSNGTKRQNVDQLAASAVERLLEYETVFIIIDDAHFLFHQKRYYDENYSLLKQIADAQFANVLLAGLPHLEEVVKAEYQLARRTGFLEPLPKFDAATEARHYQAFLVGVDQRLPFAKESGLGNPATVERLFLGSGGSVGLTMSVIKRAARTAITAKAACIMDHHIAAAVKHVLLFDQVAFHGEDD